MRGSDKEFIAEAEDLIESAVNTLLGIQEQPVKEIDPDAVNGLFRVMHTLKGLSGLYGYQGLTDISHALESLLDDIRLGKAELSEEVFAFLFKYIDVIRSIVNGFKDKKQKKIDASQNLAEIEAFRESMKAAGSGESLKGKLPDELLKVLSEYEEHRLKTNIKDGKNIYVVRTVFNLLDFDVKLKDLTAAIKALGELISTMPTSEGVPDGSLGFHLLIGSSKPIDDFRKSTGCDVETLYSPAQAEPARAEEAAAESIEGSLKTSASTVRVDIQKLDRILNTIGGINMTKEAIDSIWDELSEEYGHTPALIDLYRVAQTLDRKLAELQGQVLEIRMVPVAQIFSRLGQVVRRYSRKVNKKIDIELYGEETEIDKFLAEEIIDALVHIVRNSIDHGLEPSDERVKAGKKEAGKIRLRAMQRGNNVVIEVSDDGRGIRPERIIEKAVEKNLIEPDAQLTLREVYDLMFLPGFSTKESVSEVSGRGVGLDIVRDKAASLGGFVEVSSKVGDGTKFSLTLPITLAIVRSLLVKSGDERFAVPLSSMSETVTVDKSAINSIEGRRFFNLRGDVVPLVFLRELFDIPGPQPDHSFAAIVGYGDRKIGLIADELLVQHDIVIKSVSEYLEGTKGIAGAAEIGRHEVILVLDVEAIIEESLTKKAQATV